MNILSYRGSDAPGGVSSALSHVFSNYAKTAKWWHMKGCDLVRENKIDRRLKTNVALSLNQSLLDNHYRFCNETIWPSMHDLPQYCQLSNFAQGFYRQFNRTTADALSKGQTAGNDSYFINDYQFALVPKYLGAANCLVFWHIPWPKEVENECAPYLIELAEAMLYSSVLAFHIEEYVQNFCAFVSRFLPHYRVSGSVIESKFGRQTRVIAAPLGLDSKFWHEQCMNEPPALIDRFAGEQILLSVDRGDYTKGIVDRLEAIELFLFFNPQYHGKVRFVQLLTHSRSQLESFDNYVQRATTKANSINARFGQGGWEPIAWIEDSLPIEKLAPLYRRADVMMVTPVRDGLNLTAKEYVACHETEPGALILSPSAGVWQELGRYAITAKTSDRFHMADMIQRTLEMTTAEKVARMRLMQRSLDRNSISSWWSNLLDQWQVTQPAALAQVSS